MILLKWMFVIGAGVLMAQGAGPVVISEFVADNSDGLVDEDNDHSDWIELHNVSSGAVNLEGWFLTDSARNLRRWRLPSTNLPVNGYLVIFASDKDRRTAGRPLHTSFRLSADGEYLALVMPDGVTITTEFRPEYPQQFDDVSYGTGMEVAETQLIGSGARAQFLVPLNDAAEGSWRDREFEASAWRSGEMGLGFAADESLAGSGLFGYWPVREGTGTVAANLVSGGIAGTIHGASWTNDPVRGTVLSFNGVNSYVSAGTIPRMPTTSKFTWSFWYKQRSARNLNAVILGNRSGGAPGSLQFIKFTPSNFEYFHDGHVGTIPHLIASGGWRHVAVVKDGPSLTYYDNGTVAGSSRAGGDIEVNPLYWGGDPGAPGEYIDGLIDDVSLWSSALTAEQIRTLSNGTSPTWLSGLGGFVRTEIADQMRGINGSVYVRMPFVVEEGTTFSTLKLRMQYDDGFVAFINGMEAARRNAPEALRWNSNATEEQAAAQGSVFEEMDITAAAGALVTGTNVLAIQGLNLSAADGDFLVRAELEGRKEKELGWRYFTGATPGKVNEEGVLGFVAETVFDREHGFCEAPFTLTLSCGTTGATIRYTTNGMEPSLETGMTYVRPLSIRGTTVVRAAGFKAGYKTIGSQTRSYLFLDEILKQTGAGLPNDWGGDWRMDPRVVTNAAYAGRIRDDMKSLPVVSIALDPVGFWGPSGIYTRASGRGDEYERPASAEMFFPDGSEAGFQVNCGVQIVGGASRTMSPKHGIGLTFKSRYGPGKLRHRFFPDTPVEEFDFIAFRALFNMSWVRTDNSGPLNNANADGAERLHAIYVRDQFTRETQLAMGQAGAHGRFVHLYINGMYWGLYNPCERTDAAFAAAYFGGEKEEYDAIFSDGSTIARAHDGDKNAWLEMLTLAKQGLASASAYAEIQKHLNVTNLADYMMLNFYCATVDWPWQNWNAARKRADGAQFHFFIWDAEYTLETPPWVPDDRTGVGGESSEADSPARLYHELRENAEWRLLFADRVQKHFFNGGALTTNEATARFLRLCDTIDGAIAGESARWGDVVRRTQPYTRNVEWLAEKNRLLREFFPQRTGRVIQQFIKAGLYPAVAAPELKVSSGGFTMSAPAGVIYFTTDGQDPRKPGGAVAAQAQIYTGPVAARGGTRILARVLRNNVWSALSEGAFVAPPALSVRISGGGAVLSWPADVAGFLLESAETLSSGLWQEVAGAGENSVVVAVTGERRFYRLRKR